MWWDVGGMLTCWRSDTCGVLLWGSKGIPNGLTFVGCLWNVAFVEQWRDKLVLTYRYRGDIVWA